MKNFSLISKSVAQKLCSTLALVLISGSMYAGGGIWSNDDSKNTKSNNSSKFSNNKNSFIKKNSFKDKKSKKFVKGKHGGVKKGGKHNPKSVPLDGGLSILLLGAAAFGVKKLRNNS